MAREGWLPVDRAQKVSLTILMRANGYLDMIEGSRVEHSEEGGYRTMRWACPGLSATAKKPLGIRCDMVVEEKALYAADVFDGFMSRVTSEVGGHRAWRDARRRQQRIEDQDEEVWPNS